MTHNAVIFVCDARDYHAMDWFHEVRDICRQSDVFVATDVATNGNESSLIHRNDKVIELYNIHWLLSETPSRLGDIRRNVIKAVIAPLQVFGLRNLAEQYPGAVFHAHSMYYIFLCWLARLGFVATPMGSDVLVRPDESWLYKYLTVRSLKAARSITVDSVKMQQKVKELSNRNSDVIQNGVDVRRMSALTSRVLERRGVVSIRGFYPNYRIERVLDSRDSSSSKINLTFVYPFFESGYLTSILERLIPGDENLGRLQKTELYKLLATSLLVVSIPDSDSSPRSVYEAIFCGCCVAVVYSPWIDSLPKCMAERVVVVDLENQLWLERAIETAKRVTKVAYVPSMEALMAYDQHESMKRVCWEVYRIPLEGDVLGGHPAAVKLKPDKQDLLKSSSR